MTTKQRIQESLKRFDEIGFGNQAVIINAKRVELKNFMRQELTIIQKEAYQQGRSECHCLDKYKNNNLL